MIAINDATSMLAPYPMEELARIRANLQSSGKDVFDFGTGDPQIPTWEPIAKKLASAIPKISQYPSVRGTEDLREAMAGYFARRFDLPPSDDFSIIPTAGSKEAVFHIALSLIGRGGKKTLIYPTLLSLTPALSLKKPSSSSNNPVATFFF